MWLLLSLLTAVLAAPSGTGSYEFGNGLVQATMAAMTVHDSFFDPSSNLMWFGGTVAGATDFAAPYTTPYAGGTDCLLVCVDTVQNVLIGSLAFGSDLDDAIMSVVSDGFGGVIIGGHLFDGGATSVVVEGVTQQGVFSNAFLAHVATNSSHPYGLQVTSLRAWRGSRFTSITVPATTYVVGSFVVPNASTPSSSATAARIPVSQVIAVGELLETVTWAADLTTAANAVGTSQLVVVADVASTVVGGGSGSAMNQLEGVSFLPTHAIAHGPVGDRASALSVHFDSFLGVVVVCGVTFSRPSGWPSHLPADLRLYGSAAVLTVSGSALTLDDAVMFDGGPSSGLGVQSVVCAPDGAGGVWAAVTSPSLAFSAPRRAHPPLIAGVEGSGGYDLFVVHLAAGLVPTIVVPIGGDPADSFSDYMHAGRVRPDGAGGAHVVGSWAGGPLWVNGAEVEPGYGGSAPYNVHFFLLHILPDGSTGTHLVAQSPIPSATLLNAAFHTAPAGTTLDPLLGTPAAHLLLLLRGTSATASTTALKISGGQFDIAESPSTYSFMITRGTAPSSVLRASAPMVPPTDGECERCEITLSRRTHVRPRSGWLCDSMTSRPRVQGGHQQHMCKEDPIAPVEVGVTGLWSEVVIGATGVSHAAGVGGKFLYVVDVDCLRVVELTDAAVRDAAAAALAARVPIAPPPAPLPYPSGLAISSSTPTVYLRVSRDKQWVYLLLNGQSSWRIHTVDGTLSGPLKQLETLRIDSVAWAQIPFTDVAMMSGQVAGVRGWYLLSIDADGNVSTSAVGGYSFPSSQVGNTLDRVVADAHCVSHFHCVWVVAVQSATPMLHRTILFTIKMDRPVGGGQWMLSGFSLVDGVRPSFLAYGVGGVSIVAGDGPVYVVVQGYDEVVVLELEDSDPSEAVISGYRGRLRAVDPLLAYGSAAEGSGVGVLFRAHAIGLVCKSRDLFCAAVWRPVDSATGSMGFVATMSRRPQAGTSVFSRVYSLNVTGGPRLVALPRPKLVGGVALSEHTLAAPSLNVMEQSGSERFLRFDWMAAPSRLQSSASVPWPFYDLQFTDEGGLIVLSESGWVALPPAHSPADRNV